MRNSIFIAGASKKALKRSVWRARALRRFLPTVRDALRPTDDFLHRHIGPNEDEIDCMLEALSYKSLDALVDDTVPRHIRSREDLSLDEPLTEQVNNFFKLNLLIVSLMEIIVKNALSAIQELAKKNQLKENLIGTGYYETVTPPVILRNMLENPGWYTAYTPYQAEISQGRLENLLNFQTMVADLTGGL